GTLHTASGTESTVHGTLARAPCSPIDWQLTAIDLAAGTAAGTWTNSGTRGSGTLTGNRIAALGATRILHAHPPAALPGAIVTLRGERLDGVSALGFNGTPQSFFSGDATRIVTRVPSGTTPGPVQITA